MPGRRRRLSWSARGVSPCRAAASCRGSASAGAQSSSSRHASCRWSAGCTRVRCRVRGLPGESQAAVARALGVTADALSRSRPEAIGVAEWVVPHFRDALEVQRTGQPAKGDSGTLDHEARRMPSFGIRFFVAHRVPFPLLHQRICAALCHLSGEDCDTRGPIGSRAVRSNWRDGHRGALRSSCGFLDQPTVFR